MKYIDRPSGCFVDRLDKEPDLESIDVLMLTLDADNFLEKCLYAVYREIPVRKLIVCDGGSKDETLQILKNFPRVELHVRPDIKTTGKSMDFLMSLAETEWFVLLDADLELGSGWYDEMLKHTTNYDVLENSRRILGYHFYRQDTRKLEESCRALDFCHLIRKSAVRNFYCDDDYMWRFTDIMFRQVVENSGCKYGKISTTMHVHNETERVPYQSDEDKNFHEVVFSEPQWVIIDQNKFEAWKVKHAKAIVKYLDPEHPIVKIDRGYIDMIKLLDRKWIEENGPKWLEKYDEDDRTNQ